MSLKSILNIRKKLSMKGRNKRKNEMRKILIGILRNHKNFGIYNI